MNELKSVYDEAINSFEKYSNEYMEIKGLRYESQNQSFVADSCAVHPKKLVGLQIATRPDCIDEDIAKLLAGYKNKLYVAVELGLQTVNDNDNFLNRCYTNNDFENAVNILNKYNIDVVAHIMVGLPKRNSNFHETHKDIVRTVEFINSQNIQGLKIHSCYIIKNTILEVLFNDNKYTPLSLEEYLEELSYILTHISPNIVVHRISGDAPKDILVAPDWNTHKKWILNGILKKIIEEDLWQGKEYK